MLEMITRRASIALLSISAIAASSLAKVATAIGTNAMMAPRSDADLSWMKKALTHLGEIDKKRAIGRRGDDPFCIFEVGDVYVQFVAPAGKKILYIEAASSKSVPKLATVLTPTREKRLYEFGFKSPETSPNYSQEIAMNSTDDLAYAAQLAFQTLCTVYGVGDFASGKFLIHIPDADKVS